MHTQNWTQQPRQQQMETEQMAAMQAEQERQRDGMTGVWAAIEYGGHGASPQCSLFKTEIDALRHAIKIGGEVKFAPYGSDVFG